ncbi:hypothetical protein [Limnohabitans curvus]|uniref:hypothetical protein n=1 Tax=Limnohabitans curvus TaxID=323423 RepID=UPI0011B216CD|nr:hypothetical protein [Limnohabitans curvus]
MHRSLLFLIPLLIVGLQALIGFGVYQAFPDWATRGQFGDVFGVVNALFSGLAFAGLIYTVFLQREELSLQRKELELTRLELQRTAKAQEQSEIALRAQAEAALQSARLTTTNALLEHYRVELSRFKMLNLPGSDPRRVQVKELEVREQTLLAILDSLYVQISSEEIGNE